MPEEELPYTTLRERAAAACKTIGVLVEHGLPAEAVTKTNVDEQVVQKLKMRTRLIKKLPLAKCLT